jgi:hypothetical protein
VAQGFAQIRSDYGVDVANLPRRLLWTGRVRDRDVTVLAVTLPDGAVITALLEGGIEGGVVSTAVLPAGPLDGLMLATSNTGDDVTYVEVLVPRGTTRLRLEDGGRITTVPVGRAPGLVSVRYDFSTSGDGTDVRVTALAADGDPIATAGVNVGLVSGSGLRPPDPT